MGLPDHCETVVGEAELPRSGLDAGLKAGSTRTTPNLKML
jgi:hypothetical protein